MNESWKDMTREQLYTLIENCSKNWLAMDGVWFQSVENEYGLEEALKHDAAAWVRFTKIEAKRAKEFLELPDRAGLEGLKRALNLRMYANMNKDSYEIVGNTLKYKIYDCRVQHARTIKGMPMHPCKSIGIIARKDMKLPRNLPVNRVLHNHINQSAAVVHNRVKLL